jgi:beta-galactosidase
MNHKILTIVFFALALRAYAQSPRYELPFDDHWKFRLVEANDVVKLSFDDKSWRDVDLPHDWSIEKLPAQEAGKVVGPFQKRVREPRRRVIQSAAPRGIVKPLCWMQTKSLPVR